MNAEDMTDDELIALLAQRHFLFVGATEGSALYYQARSDIQEAKEMLLRNLEARQRAQL